MFIVLGFPLEVFCNVTRFLKSNTFSKSMGFLDWPFLAVTN